MNIRKLEKALSKMSDEEQIDFIMDIIQKSINTSTDSKGSLIKLLELNNRIYNLAGSESVKYGNGLHTKHKHIKYHDFFINNISPGERILDIGCGNGFLSYDIVTNVENVVLTGIDLSKDNIDFAKEKFKHPNLNFIVGDALKGLPDEKFDVVVLSNVLEHIENRVDFLKGIASNISPQKYLLRVPSFERDWRVPLMKELGMDYWLDPTHYIEYTQEEFVNEVSDADLGIKDFHSRWGEYWVVVEPKGGNDEQIP